MNEERRERNLLNGATIRARLDLCIRLLDTVSGAVVTARDVRFIREGKLLPMTARADGYYLLINRGREDFLMRIEADGFDPVEQPVVYAELDERLPMIDVFLIQSENSRRHGYSVLTFSGQLTGLELIEAVNPAKPLCGVGEYRERKQELSLVLPNRRLSMESVYYAAMCRTEEQETFRTFVVQDIISQTVVSLASPLEGPVDAHAPICRVIRGRVDDRGNYLLRVREEPQAEYLIHYRVRGIDHFVSADMHDPDGIALRTQ